MPRSSSLTVPPGFRDSAQRPLAAHEVIASTYEVREELTRTETGIVFEARDMVLDRLVALKLAWRDPGTPSLLIEARRCAAVRDACAVQIHGMGSHLGAEYVVAERVTGKLLREELAQARAIEVYFARLRGIVTAVVRAHDAGIAVGEISGSTVLVGADDRLVLGRLSLSQVPAFGRLGRILAPEVVRGEVDAADPAAAEAIDLYGIGCVAIELACGLPPFADDDPVAELRGHAEKPPPHLAELRGDLSTELSDVVDWLLAKAPAARPRSARDVLAQLDAIHERVGGRARPVRVLIVDDDTARARWLWSLARRAHAAAIVEIASEGTDAAHKLNRDLPDLVLVDAGLRGVMNALELCMYARGIAGSAPADMVVIGEIAERDRALLASANARFFLEDANLPGAILDTVRAAVLLGPRAHARKTISG